jgi:hypothetical protein
MPATYEPIATTTLGTAANSITFSSIASTYTDLVIVFTATCATAGTTGQMLLNGATSGYSATFLRGTTAAAASNAFTSDSSLTVLYQALSSTNTSFARINIFNYAGSTFKSILVEDAQDYNGSGQVMRSVGLYQSTSAITSITLRASSGNNLAVGTAATIYGIKKA